jgi:2,3-bisphosphoglycerate-dependent phosphoglycerate mutase
MPHLIIIRHGQSEWNLQNRFTGIADVGLTPLGIEEAKNAARLIKPYPVDLAYTSVLKRAIHTLEIIIKENGYKSLPVIYAAELNERDYGDLQGLNKDDTAKKYSPEQVHEWRRSYDIAPPGGESLKDTCNRVIPYYTGEIEPALKKGKNILIVAHGNSLRALMMNLEKISKKDISGVDLPTGVPRVYEFSDSLSLIKVVDFR